MFATCLSQTLIKYSLVNTFSSKSYYVIISGKVMTSHHPGNFCWQGTTDIIYNVYPSIMLRFFTCVNYKPYRYDNHSLYACSFGACWLSNDSACRLKMRIHPSNSLIYSFLGRLGCTRIQVNKQCHKDH